MVKFSISREELKAAKFASATIVDEGGSIKDNFEEMLVQALKVLRA